MEDKQGKIQVTVQASERMKAITELSIAIRLVAEALNRPPQVTVSDCTFIAGEAGIVIDTAEEVTTTTIHTLEQD